MIKNENLTMLTDFYELTMANGYLKSGMKDHIAYFDLPSFVERFVSLWLLRQSVSNPSFFIGRYRFMLCYRMHLQSRACYTCCMDTRMGMHLLSIIAHWSNTVQEPLWR